MVLFIAKELRGYPKLFYFEKVRLFLMFQEQPSKINVTM